MRGWILWDLASKISTPLDVIARWTGNFLIDSLSGVLPSGKSFKNADELIRILQDDKRRVLARCLVEKMLTFAIGRGLERYDRPVVNGIAHRLAEKQYKFSALVMEIVNSAPFQMCGTPKQ